MIIKKELVFRDIMGEKVLVPCGNTVFSDNGLFMLNDVGAFIWQILPEVSDENEIVQRVLDEYDIDMNRAQKDVETFLASLRKFKIID